MGRVPITGWESHPGMGMSAQVSMTTLTRVARCRKVLGPGDTIQPGIDRSRGSRSTPGHRGFDKSDGSGLAKVIVQQYCLVGRINLVHRLVQLCSHHPGKSAHLAGFGDRLLNEVKKLALKDVKLKIYAPPERKVCGFHCQ